MMRVSQNTRRIVALLVIVTAVLTLKTGAATAQLDDSIGDNVDDDSDVGDSIENETEDIGDETDNRLGDFSEAADEIQDFSSAEETMVAKETSFMY